MEFKDETPDKGGYYWALHALYTEPFIIYVGGYGSFLKITGSFYQGFPHSHDSGSFLWGPRIDIPTNV